MKPKGTLTLTLTLIITLTLIMPAYSYDIGIPVPEFRGSSVDMENMTVYLGYSKGAELLQNSIFTDINNHWAKRAITRMSAQSIIKGYGNNRFSPDTPISKQEVLELLVRMIGREGAVQENLANQGILNSNIINDIWAEGYILEAQSQGIILEDEGGNFTAPATREEVAVWTARLLGLQPVYNNIEIVYTFDDWRDISVSYLGIIEAVLQERIMQGEGNNFNPKKSLTRAQVASILNNISDRFYGDRDMEAFYGQVVSIQKNTVNELGSNIYESNILVKNIDGTIVSLKARAKGQTALNDFVVYKNGIVANNSILSIGDEVEYILKGDQVIYVEVYNDGSILEMIKEQGLQDNNLRTYFGTITSINSETYWSGQGNRQVTRYRVQNIDGQYFDIVVETDLVTGIKNDIIVYDGSKVGGSNLLQWNDKIEYVVRNNKTLVYVKKTTFESSIVRGTIKSVDMENNLITIVDYDNNTKVYSIVPYVNVMINLRPGELTDLKYGLNVTLNVQNGIVTSITGETYMSEPGYIPAYGRIKSGEIDYIDGDEIIVRAADGMVQRYIVTDNTSIIKDRRTIRFRDLRLGDRVQLFFSSIYTDEVDRIEVEGKEQLVKAVYKGKVNKVDVSDREVTLTNPYILRNAKWEELDDYKISIQLSDGAGIYYDGDSIDIDELEDDHINDYCYIVVEDAYGKDKGIQAVVRRGSERLYTDSIDDLNFAGNILELDNGKNISFGEETIIIKDNRLVSPSSLEEDLNALVVSEYRSGNYRANIISLGDIGYGIFENIYVGKIDLIDRDEFEIIYYSELDGNEWDDVSSSSSRGLELEYDDDTYIVDLTDGYDEISAYDFFHEGYSNEDDEDYFAFIVADEDKRVIGMTLREDELFKDSRVNTSREIEETLEDLILTKGTIEDVDDVRFRIELRDSYDWSDFYEEWRANRSDKYVYIEEALILKGDRAIEIDDLDEDDLVYIIRYDEDAVIMFVE